MSVDDAVAAFIDAATWHGTLDAAEAILASHPDMATSGIHAAAVLGDDAEVRRFLTLDPRNATAMAPPYGGNALVYLCLSKYLRFDKTRSEDFLRAATALLDAGADPNSGFWTTDEHAEFETALYGAAGVAHHPEMTRLLLERGADPNDVEAVYHSPETYENAALELLVETGRLTDQNLALMLVRKHDWHDYDGVMYLLEHGADPNLKRIHGLRAIHHAIARDNRIEVIELLLDHRADPILEENGGSAVARAARRGRGDVLKLFEQRGIPIQLQGVGLLISACARGDAQSVQSIAEKAPDIVRQLKVNGGQVLAEFAGNGNIDGLGHLLDLGIDVDAPFVEGDGYWDVAKNSTALHVSAWRAQHDAVRLLIERGAQVNLVDAKGRTPLALAVRACVDSYWTGRRSPESVEALLNAGASVHGIPFPSGYADVDDLLRRTRA